MNKRTLKALKGSIEKWRKIRDGEGIDNGVKNCPLCQLFFWSEYRCDGCPVSNRSDEDCCRNTPYEQWVDHHESRHKEEWVANDGDLMIIGKCRACRKHAQAEYDFLVSLLPEGEMP